jgi:hypothetical protein
MPGSVSSADATAKDTRPAAFEPAAPTTRPNTTEQNVTPEPNKGHQESEPVESEGRSPGADEDSAQPLRAAVQSPADADRESAMVRCCPGSWKSSYIVRITQLGILAREIRI